ADIFLDEVVTRQGTVTFTVDAADATAGIADEDVKLTLTLRGSDPAVTLPAVLQGAAETNGWMRYTFTAAIGADTANGTYDASLTVLDRSGNASETLAGAFEVQKNQFAVTVALQGAVAGPFSREVTFVATGADGGVLATWVRNISFTDGVGTDTLPEAPDGIVGLSAKTGAHLRRRLAVELDSDGQGLAEFTGTGAEGRQLLGGDLDGDNAVNMADFNRLRYYWYTVNTAADIDGDGASNLNDLNILKANWYGVGDPL
ncbi:MAG: hypothetical protein GX548_07840, partial [Lentisphaerae bacterium]|nr:hypothetical protein [Lentisphaerota bacterium]